MKDILEMNNHESNLGKYLRLQLRYVPYASKSVAFLGANLRETFENGLQIKFLAVYEKCMYKT